MRRKSRLFAHSLWSPDSRFAELEAGIVESLRAFPRIFPFRGDYRRRRVRSGLPPTMAAVARNSNERKGRNAIPLQLGTPKAARLRGAGVERLWNDRFWRRVQSIAATIELINFTGRVTALILAHATRVSHAAYFSVSAAWSKRPPICVRPLI